MSLSDDFRPCAIVPTFENPLTVRRVVEGIRGHGLEVLLVDDGSAEPGRRVCAEVAAEGLAVLVRRERNGGKGAAVMDGFRAARERGFSHGLQIDADGQHDLQRIPDFLDAGRTQPGALVLAYPEYDDSAPAVRRWGRHLTSFWVALEVGGRDKIADAMVGFRLYPLEQALALGRVGRGMDFDIEIAVRMVRAGAPTRNLPVGVRYPSADEGGISHFRVVRDNARFGLMHARLCTAGCFQWLGKRVGGGGR